MLNEKILSAVNKAIAEEDYEQALAQLDPLHYNILGIIGPYWTTEEKITRQLFLEPSVTSSAIAELIASGLIKSKEVETDRDSYLKALAGSEPGLATLVMQSGIVRDRVKYLIIDEGLRCHCLTIKLKAKGFFNGKAATLNAIGKIEVAIDREARKILKWGLIRAEDVDKITQSASNAATKAFVEATIKAIKKNNSNADRIN